MSLPQRLPVATGLDKEKGSPLSAVFPPMPFCMPPVSSGASVFPNPLLFPPNFQQIYATLMQQQFLQLAAQQQQASPAMRSSDPSPSLSDRASSGAETPSSKKLQIDDDGCPICPICSEKLPEAEWADHVELEKTRIRDSIISAKVQQPCGVEAAQSPGTLARRKRENELARVRANQLKRLSLKRAIMPSTSIRDTLTPFSRQSETLSSPDSKGNNGEAMRCAICSRETDYCIVASSFEHPRCQQCFDQMTSAPNQVLIPATLAGNPIDMRLNASESTISAEMSPPEKRIKMEE